jgi:hypothetical protein
MRASRTFTVVAALVLAAAPAIGGAQGSRPAESHDLTTPLGEYVLLGGGVTEFTDDAAKDRFDTGAAWDVRLGIGSRFYVGAEAAYTGSFRGAKGDGLDALTNGAEAVLRLQYPYVTQGWLVEPFAFGGVGWNRLSLRDAPPGVEDTDDFGVVPFGAGLMVGYRRLLFDARFTYRTSFNEDVAIAASGARPSLDQWAVNASIGYEF